MRGLITKNSFSSSVLCLGLLACDSEDTKTETVHAPSQISSAKKEAVTAASATENWVEVTGTSRNGRPRVSPFRPGRVKVSREEFAEWPLAADSAFLGCGGLEGVQSGGALNWYVYLEVDGKKYALNGTAKDRAQGLAWSTELDSVLLAASVVGVRSLIARALESCEGKPWHSGGTLHDKTALDWQIAEPFDKLATACDFVTTLYSKNALAPKVLSQIQGQGIDSVKPFAARLLIALDQAFEPQTTAEKNRKLYANQTVGETTVLLAQLMGWLKG